MPKAETRDDDLDLELEELEKKGAAGDEGQDDIDDGAASEEEKRLAAIEAKARAQGWFPESEWDEARAKRTGRPKPKFFLSAEEYLTQVDTNTPLLRSQLRRLEENNGELKKKIEDMHGIFKYQHERNKEAVKKAREQGRLDAEKKLEEAIDEGDKVKGKEARQELIDIEKAEREELLAERKPAKETEADDDADDDKDVPLDERVKKLNPVLQGWIEENSWFKSDGALNAYMIERWQALKAKSPGMEQRALLDTAKRQVRAKFPEKFGINPRRNADGGSMDNGGERGAPGRKTFDALPKEDRDMYEKHRAQFEAKGMKYTREEFLEAYHS